MKLGKTKAVEFIASGISALPRVRGQRTDAGRSAHSLSADWQAWGTKGGLCWRATRDGLRHVPASPPKSPNARNQPRIASRSKSQPAVPLRFPAATRIVFLRQGHDSISTKKRGKSPQSIEIGILSGAPSAGAGKNALFSSRGIFARGVFGVAVGVGFGVGVRATDSHAPSNTWESVQKTGIVKYLKTAAAKRQVDLHPDIAEYLQRYRAEKAGLLFNTANGTPHMYGNLEDRWLTPRLTKMGLDEKGMGWHSFKRFRKTWLRGARCLEDLNNFWMAHKPTTMSEVYSHLHEELELRLDEVARVGYGFVLPETPNVAVVPNVPKLHQNSAVEIAA